MDAFKITFYRARGFWRREKRLLAISLCAGIVMTAGFGICTKVYSDTIQKGIAGSVVRFHVLANSDSAEDQALKLLVRDRVLLEMQETLSENASVAEARATIAASLEEIRDIARAVVLENGYGYDVRVSLAKDLFPYKEYGDTAFPAGIYDALRIEIGGADGQNWWCVMFPPLCFVDEGYEEISPEGKDALRAALSDEEYEVVVSSKAGNEVAPAIKLKIVEWWQEREIEEEQYTTKK